MLNPKITQRYSYIQLTQRQKFLLKINEYLATGEASQTRV